MDIRPGESMAPLTPLEIEALSLSLKVAILSVVGALPFGIMVAWLLAAEELSRQTHRRWRGSPASCRAAGRCRIHLARPVKPQWSNRRLCLYDTFNISVAFYLEGRSTCRGRDGLSAHGESHAAVIRSG